MPSIITPIWRYLGQPLDFYIQKFISGFAIEDFVVSVLPWTVGFNEPSLHADRPKPDSDGNGRKLRNIVRADMIQWAIPDEQVRQAMKDIVGLELALDDDSQAPTGELIDHRQHAEASPVVGATLGEVIAPDMIGPTRPKPDVWSIMFTTG